MTIEFLKEQLQQLEYGMRHIDAELSKLTERRQMQVGAIQMVGRLIETEEKRRDEETSSNGDTVVPDLAGSDIHASNGDEQPNSNAQ